MKTFSILIASLLIVACEVQGQGQGQGQSQSQTQGQGGSSTTNNSGPGYNCQNGAVCGNGNNVGGNVGNGNTGGNSGSGNTTGNGNSNGGKAYTNDAGVCVPGTCTGYGISCGLSADGCDGVMNCGTCGEDASVPSNTSGAAWSPCFDPTEAYPTGILKYPDCNTYCQSVGKTCSSTTCPDPVNPANFLDAIWWCNLPAATCGDLSQYPDYISECEGKDTTCFDGANFQSCPNGTDCTCRAVDEVGGVPQTQWWGVCIIPSGATTITTSAQCCCQ